MPGGKGVVGVTYMVCPRQSTGWGSSSVDVVNTKTCQVFWPMGSLWWVQSLALGMRGGWKVHVYVQLVMECFSDGITGCEWCSINCRG